MVVEFSGLSLPPIFAFCLVSEIISPGDEGLDCPTTADSSWRWDVDVSGHPTSTRVPCHGQSQIVDRSFMAVGLQLWDNLPIGIRQEDIT